VIQEAWQQSFLPRVEEEGVGAVDIGPLLDNSTFHWKPPEEGIVLLELFGGIGSGLATVLQARSRSNVMFMLMSMTRLDKWPSNIQGD
jgi:hypothetical protein